MLNYTTISRLPLLFIFFLFSTTAYSQNRIKDPYRYRNTRNVCFDTSERLSVSYKEFIQAKQYDSAQSVLNHWKRVCPNCETIYRAELILDVVNDDIYNHIDSNTLYYILRNKYDHHRLSGGIHYTINKYSKLTFYTIPETRVFDDFSFDFFDSLRQVPNIDSNLYLVAKLYTDVSDDPFPILRDTNYSETFLGREYNRVLKKVLNMPEPSFAAMFGTWIPTGGLAKVGIHPEIGYQVGIKYKRLSFDATVIFKFLNSPNSYYATRVSSDRSVESTNRFFGGYVGLDVAYDVYAKGRNEYKALSGFGMDGFDVLDSNVIKGLGKESIVTYNFNLGVGYRYYVDPSFYIGIQAKYNVVNYRRDDIITFSGHPITITLIVGTITNKKKKSMLKALGYSRLRR